MMEEHCLHFQWVAGQEAGRTLLVVPFHVSRLLDGFRTAGYGVEEKGQVLREFL